MMNTPNGTTIRHSSARIAIASAIALALTGSAMAQPNGNGNGDPKGRPFDRAFVAASAGPELLEAEATPDSSSSEPVELLRTTFDVRPQFSRDLVLRFDAECASILDADEEGVVEIPNVTGASVRVWAEVDGNPVPVAPTGDPETEDDGSVVLCGNGNSVDFSTTEPDAIADQLAGSTLPHGFSWLAQDVGKGTHEVVIMASLDLAVEESEEEPTTEEEADAMALIGKRILTVDLANAAFEAQATDMEGEESEGDGEG